MNIDYIIEFLTINKMDSFTKAAVKLSISQSSLSKHIKSLEYELDVVLLERRTRNIVLSKAGTALLPYLTTVSNAVINLKAKSSAIATSMNKTIHILSIPVMAQYNITTEI